MLFPLHPEITTTKQGRQDRIRGWRPKREKTKSDGGGTMMTFSLWAFLPPLFSLGTAAGLWIVYIMAVFQGSVTPLTTVEYSRKNGSLFPPFISLSGNFPPASCFFSEVMDLAAFLGFVIGILRYLQLRNRLDKAWLNFVSMLAFCAGCFGMTIVGNFQILNMLMIHNVGTLMTFGLGTLYCWVQSYITLKVSQKHEGRRVAILRFGLSTCITLCFILTFALIHVSIMHAARCQWALVMFFLIFISTFAVEFRHIHFKVVCSDTKRSSLSEWDASQVFRESEDQHEDQAWDQHQDQPRDLL